MAAKDAVTKDYMRNPAVFADAFNFLLYGGRSVINPEKLHDLDTVEIVLPYGEDGTVAPTLVVLFSPEPWDGPMSIHGMLSGVEKEILPFIADYRIKYSTDKKQLKRLLDTDTHYQAMDLDAATVINTVTNTKLKLKKKEGKVNMCLAIEEMCRESRLEGEKRARRRAKTWEKRKARNGAGRQESV